MVNDRNTLYFDHEGDFEITVENNVLSVDINSIQKIIFTDHANMVRYTFSKFRTDMVNDVCPIDQTKLQSN